MDNTNPIRKRTEKYEHKCFFDIEDLEYAEIYVVFNEKDGK